MKKLSILLVFFMLFALTPALAANVGMMSLDELKGVLDSENLIVLDARTGKDWGASEFKIPGAIRANPSEFNSWGNSYPKEKKIVLYCA